ncbi:helix-turn-helix transcriptional regulator [Knoellia koreensis]|uniref:Helix-turn-helix transcriptional regulator n=1 Tax=Knoellia koreensis TaxID=2730921 RepID=A0A849HD63_9MICO|nr:helix-turn-helix transcriptional regulator [Knoellia sp. DB2414S]NNM44583.1 helix-turn-helix transcriptional regulator [Knoellia sp. DB2414S]
MERESRGMNYDSLSKRTEAAGCKIHASALWKIEKGDPPRRITVDELVVLSKVFGVPMAELVTDPELQLPGHAIELAEKAAAAFLDAYQLSMEAEDAARRAGELMEQLRSAIGDRHELAAHIAEAVDANHPEWAVGLEEHHISQMVVEALRAIATGEEQGNA